MLLLLLTACAAVLPAPTLRSWGHVDVAAGDVSGLSGLAAGADGTLWSVSEGPPRLVQLDGGGASVLRALPIIGLPAGAEPESVVITASGAIWVGTESDTDARAADPVVRLAIVGDHAEVREQRLVSWADWGLVAPENRGVEGLCEAGGRLVAGGEPVSEEGGRRRAPLGLASADGWINHWFPLGTDTGKLAALWCQQTTNGDIEIEAIERHYGVLHVVQARLPAGAAPGTEAERTGEFPLDPAILAMNLNFEGLTRVGSRRLLLSDNQSGGEVKGPTRIVRVDPIDEDEDEAGSP